MVSLCYREECCWSDASRHREVPLSNYDTAFGWQISGWATENKPSIARPVGVTEPDPHKRLRLIELQHLFCRTLSPMRIPAPPGPPRFARRWRPAERGRGSHWSTNPP